MENISSVLSRGKEYNKYIKLVKIVIRFAKYLLLKITKAEVDSFKPGKRIPSCHIKAEWTKQSKPPRLKYTVTLQGAKQPSNYFNIDLDCDSIQGTVLIIMSIPFLLKLVGNLC